MERININGRSWKVYGEPLEVAHTLVACTRQNFIADIPPTFSTVLQFSTGPQSFEEH